MSNNTKKQKFRLDIDVQFLSYIREYTVHYQRCLWRERSQKGVETVNREGDSVQEKSDRLIYVNKEERHRARERDANGERGMWDKKNTMRV